VTYPGGAMMTMITTGALVYRPERVQFYCVAASGPRLAAVADPPHVASVVASFHTEGVNRLLPRCARSSTTVKGSSPHGDWT